MFKCGPTKESRIQSRGKQMFAFRSQGIYKSELYRAKEMLYIFVKDFLESKQFKIKNARYNMRIQSM